MYSGKVKSYTIHPSDYKKAIANEADFYIQFHTFMPDVEGAIIKGIHRYMEHYDLNYISNQVINVLKELINNAIKANLKRIYFKLKDLDIEKTEDYRTGMETFKDEAYVGASEEYLEKLEKSNLVVRVSFKTTAEYMYINVINNVPILRMELSKINARIKKAYKYRDISEAFDEVLDESEGAGLGLIKAMMIFKKWNFNEALVNTIEYHHRPHMAPSNLKQLIYIVYLADCMVEIDMNRFRYEFIDEDVIDYFNLSDRNTFENLHKILRESYESQLLTTL